MLSAIKRLVRHPWVIVGSNTIANKLALNSVFIDGSSVSVLEGYFSRFERNHMVSPKGRFDTVKVKEAAQALVEAHAAKAEEVAIRLLDPMHPTEFAEAVLAEVRGLLGERTDR